MIRPRSASSGTRRAPRRLRAAGAAACSTTAMSACVVIELRFAHQQVIVLVCRLFTKSLAPDKLPGALLASPLPVLHQHAPAREHHAGHAGHLHTLVEVV